MSPLTRLLAATLLCGAWGTALPAQATAPRSAGEVRQIVTFLWQPGMAAQAAGIYERSLKPIYTALPALRRFRAYREVESPEPLDLVVVSTYDGMAGMDAANAGLRTPNADGESALALYGRLSAMSQQHHDQFVEMLPALSDSATDGGELTVFEYLRVMPGTQSRWATQLVTLARPAERAARLHVWSETGRMLVSDGWDYVRMHGIRTLGDWQRIREFSRTSPPLITLDAMVVARKTIIVRREARLSVR